MASLQQITMKMIETNVFNSIVVIKGATQISRRVILFSLIIEGIGRAKAM